MSDRRRSGSGHDRSARSARNNIRQMPTGADRAARRSTRMGGQRMQDAAPARKLGPKRIRKLVVLFVCVLLAFVGLSVRLFWIMQEDGERYTKQVLSQRGYDSKTLPFRRGDILDSNGNLLATSEKVYNLVTDSTVMLYNKKDGEPVNLEPTMEALGRHFDLDIDEVRKYTLDHPNSAWKVWLRQLSYDEMKSFQDEMEMKGSLIKGVWFEEEYKRRYPNGSLASDVIGFTGRDNVGSYGLEEYYNDTLNGTTGREYGYLNEDSVLEGKVKPAVDGYTIHSTIDLNIQKVVEKYIAQFIEEHANEAHPGNGAQNVGCIVMKANTGEVLAMASSCPYDLNNPRDTSPLLGSIMVEEVENQNGYIEIHKTGTVFDESVINQLTDSSVDEQTKEANERKLLVNLNYLWKNFCISDTYEPGSTAKPFTVASALESGTITGNEVYTCNGVLVRGGHEIKCHGGNGHGSVSVRDSIAWSCNMALIQIAETLGVDGFVDFQKKFNFGLKTNIDLTGEARTAGLVFSAEAMKNDGAALATNAFGQGFNVTMIEMITAYCSLINGGYYYEPHMVDKITNSSGATVTNIEPRVLKQVISESTSEKIRQYTRATVMEEGGANRTGKTARPAGYAIGGKTGTAQTQPRGNGEYVVSFIGHAPADDPQIAIYVVVDRANAAVQADAKYATGIVRNVLTEILPYLQIFMTEELSDAEVEELNQRQLEITNQYTQLPEEDALEDLDDEGDEDQEGDEGQGQAPWMSYPKDPDTGYLKNPDTGELVDPQTGDIIDAQTGQSSDENWDALGDWDASPDGNGEPADSPL